MADEQKNNSNPSATPDEQADADKRQAKTPELVDEYGEPLPDEEHEHARKRPLYKRPVFMIVGAFILLTAFIAVIAYWLYARSHESTDDAFVDAHIIQVSPKVSGHVTKIYVTDNQQVKAGDLLAELDPRDLQAKLDQAKAALEAGQAQQKEAQSQTSLTHVSTRASIQQASAGVQQARAGVASARAGASAEHGRTQQATAAIGNAEANMQQARAQETAAIAEGLRADADVRRYKTLYEKDEVSQQQYDQAIAAARTANAQVNAAREKVLAADAQIREARAAASAQTATAQRAETQVAGARAQVNEALGRLTQARTAPQQIATSEAKESSAQAHIGELQAAVDQAELELSYTKIYAPDSGRI